MGGSINNQSASVKNTGNDSNDLPNEKGGVNSPSADKARLVIQESLKQLKSGELEAKRGWVKEQNKWLKKQETLENHEHFKGSKYGLDFSIEREINNIEIEEIDKRLEELDKRQKNSYTEKLWTAVGSIKKFFGVTNDEEHSISHGDSTFINKTSPSENQPSLKSGVSNENRQESRPNSLLDSHSTSETPVQAHSLSKNNSIKASRGTQSMHEKRGYSLFSEETKISRPKRRRSI